MAYYVVGTSRMRRFGELVKDFIKLFIYVLLVFIVLALGAYFCGKIFLSYTLLLFLGFIMPFIVWKKKKEREPIPKIYFLVSGTTGFLIYLILWIWHGPQGSAPVTLFDMILSIFVWSILDRKIKKFLKINTHKKEIRSNEVV